MKINFYKKIYNDDIIYHYTKASTAIDYILYNNQLRFSKALSSSDPIESKTAIRSTVYSNYDAKKNHNDQHYNDINELHKTLINLHHNFNQICFCKNTPNDDNEYYLSNLDQNEDLFGFNKLRMWDQYGDRFTGVCIAFSKDKIINLNKERLSLINGNIEYLKIHELRYKKVGDIQGNYLLNVGKEKYKQELESYLKESLFYKHIDYSGENEFRIGTLFDKDKCEVEIVRNEVIIEQNMMLDITGCIEAIFVSSFANEKQKNELLNYANELKVELIEMRWEHNSFEAQKYREWDNILSSIQEENN